MIFLIIPVYIIFQTDIFLIEWSFFLNIDTGFYLSEHFLCATLIFFLKKAEIWLLISLSVNIIQYYLVMICNCSLKKSLFIYRETMLESPCLYFFYLMQFCILWIKRNRTIKWSNVYKTSVCCSFWMVCIQKLTSLSTSLLHHNFNVFLSNLHWLSNELMQLNDNNEVYSFEDNIVKYI